MMMPNAPLMRRDKLRRRTDREVLRPAQRLIFRRTRTIPGNTRTRRIKEACFSGGKAGYLDSPPSPRNRAAAPAGTSPGFQAD
ncbi:Uncharacterised protein [Raoultella ornithinolytica]|nr:Uncharacterised protein [Raoultella ornithinolytica]